MPSPEKSFIQDGAVIRQRFTLYCVYVLLHMFLKMKKIQQNIFDKNIIKQFDLNWSILRKLNPSRNCKETDKIIEKKVDQ